MSQAGCWKGNVCAFALVYQVHDYTSNVELSPTVLQLLSLCHSLPSDNNFHFNHNAEVPSRILYSLQQC